MRLQVRVAAFALLVVMVAVWTVPVSAGPNAVEDPATLTRRVAELVNQERLKAGLLPLKWNDTLAAAATTYARDLAARNYFAHNSLEGSTPASRARDAGYDAYGWGGVYVGENLARGYSTAEGAMAGWLASEGHRNNLLHSKYRETGVGMAVAANGGVVLAQEFGSRPKVLPVFIDGDAETTDTTNVTLTLTSEEVSDWGSVGKLTEMMVSNAPDFAGARWEPFANTKYWKLTPQPGPKTVYVRLRDAKGTVVESSDHIVLTGREAMNVAATEPAAIAQSKPQFRLGFKTLAELIPKVVGVPLSEEQADSDGNSIQMTSTGLMVWIKSTNWTAFTDGFWTWINGPFGLQRRTNEQRFDWER
ncbi:MAG: CAP domain-containing protein [Sphingomonadaceae bacterium]